MASKTQPSTRPIMFSDIQKLINTLNLSELNCKIACKLSGKTFRKHHAFTLPNPDITKEQNKTYLLNSLINLRDHLNELELGQIQEQEENDQPF